MKHKVFQRDVFIDEIFRAAQKDREIYFISPDLGAPALDEYRERLPDRFVHSGISEQHMIDMAAGLALSGKKVYVYGMGPFVSLRCLEQIKCSLAMMDLPVTILSCGVGLGYADAGPTHYATEDIACMRAIVGAEVWSPCDEVSTRRIAQLTLEKPGLRFVRLERHALPPIYSNDFSIESRGYKEISGGGRVCVLSYGHLLHRVLQIKDIDKQRECGLIDLYCLKPIHPTIVDVLKRYRGIVTVEEQCLQGGFGSAVLEVLADRGVQIPVTRLGLPERYYFENGGREYLLDRFGLSIADIAKAVDDLDPL